MLWTDVYREKVQRLEARGFLFRSRDFSALHETGGDVMGSGCSLPAGRRIARLRRVPLPKEVVAACARGLS